MDKPIAIALLLLDLAIIGVPETSFGTGAALRCSAADDWQSTVEATVRDARDAEHLSLALTSMPGCSKIAMRSNYLCSWRIEKRLFDDAIFVGDTVAAVVCVVDPAGMIASTSPARERDEAVSTCSIRFEFRPDPAGPCGSADE